MLRETLLHNKSAFALAMVTLVLLAYVVNRVLVGIVAPDGSHDFHPFWFHGIALRQGENPYRTTNEGWTPRLPIFFLDGVTVDHPPVAQPNLSNYATDSAPLGLVMFLFSNLSWERAKLAWGIMNLAFFIVLPFLVLKFFPRNDALSLAAKALVFLITYTMVSSRGALAIGQTTIVVFMLVLVALLLRDRAWLLAGIALGIAVSKYSLVLPAVLFLLLEGRLKNVLILATAFVVQGMGIVVISLLTGDTPVLIVQNYLQIFSTIASTHGEIGVQLSRLVGSGTRIHLALSLVLSAVLVGGLAYLWRRRPLLSKPRQDLLNYSFWIVVTLWTMLLFYHGGYDLAIITPIVPFLLFAFSSPHALGLTMTERWFALAALTVFVAVYCMPLQLVEYALQRTTEQTAVVVEQAYVWTLLFLFVVSCWFLVRTARVTADQTDVSKSPSARQQTATV